MNIPEKKANEDYQEDALDIKGMWKPYYNRSSYAEEGRGKKIYKDFIQTGR